MTNMTLTHIFQIISALCVEILCNNVHHARSRGATQSRWLKSKRLFTLFLLPSAEIEQDEISVDVDSGMRTIHPID